MTTPVDPPGVLLRALALACVLCASTSAAQERRPNVLFIAIDDLRTELGCYGVPDARTPALDRLASQGVLFTRHYVQVPTCGASRYAMLTGRSPARSKALRNNAFYGGLSALSQEPAEGAQSLPELFRRSGYRTVCIGKISHTPDGRVYAYDGSGDGRDEVPLAWDELPTPFGPWKRGWGIFFAYEGGEHREDGGGHRDLVEFTAEGDDDLPDGLLASQAVRTLAELEERDEPFFLGLGFFKPHLPFVAPKADWEAMAEVDVQAPASPERPDSVYWHKSNEMYGYHADHEKTRPLAPEARIEARRAYLACVRYVDRQVGRVLDALDELELADSTIVVVWGDHGWHLGESALWGKHVLYERALNSALIVRAPGVAKAGLRSDALVESLDLFPTIVELAAPKFRRTEHALDGVSLRPLLTGEAESVRDVAISYWRKSVSVRDASHRVIGTRDGDGWKDVELYALEDGLDPIRDLAGDRGDVVDRLLSAASE